MMICPQTKAECPCTSVLCCVRSTRDPSVSWIAPPKPTMAEFERLVDAYGEAMQSLCNFDECGTGNGRPKLEADFDAALAALIDYVKRMGVE